MKNVIIIIDEVIIISFFVYEIKIKREEMVLIKQTI